MKTTEHEPLLVKTLPQPQPPAIDVNADCQSIVVEAPLAEVYRRLLRFEDLPRFITSINRVEKISDTRFISTSTIAGTEVESAVEIMMRVPNRRIAWQAVSDQFRVGVVFLDPRLGGGTKVTVKVRSIAEPVLLTRGLRQYLKNFKRFIEEKVK